MLWSSLLLLIVARRLYRPLIGGPSWLRIHQVLQLEEDREGGRVVKVQLDFVPRYAGDPMELLRLLLGGEVDGVVRLRCNHINDEDTDESASRSRLLRSFLHRILPFLSLSSSSSSSSSSPSCSFEEVSEVSGFSTKLHLYNNNCVHFIDFCIWELDKES